MSEKPYGTGPKCRTTHYGCDCVLEQLRLAESKLAVAMKALERIEDPMMCVSRCCCGDRQAIASKALAEVNGK